MMTSSWRPQRPHWLSIESYGLLLLLLSAILFAISGAFVKLGYIHGGLPSTELLFLRGIFQGSVIVFGLSMGRDEATGDSLIRHPFGRGSAAQKVAVARGIIGGAAYLLDFHCMAVLQLGDAIAIVSIAPSLTIILARIYLGEVIRRLHVHIIVAGIAGAVLVAQPTFLFGRDASVDAPPAMGYVTAVLAAFCYSCSMILIRKGRAVGLSANQLMFPWAICVIALSVVFGSAEGQWEYPASRQIWWYVLGVGTFGAASNFLGNYAGRLAPAGLGSVMRASDMVWAYVFEIFVFHQEPNASTWLGVLLVLGSLVAVGVDKIRDGRRVMKKMSSVEHDEEKKEEDYHVEMEEGKSA